MLDRIKSFFQQQLIMREAETARQAEHRLQLAVAALLLEMTRMDEHVREEECARVEQGIRSQFDLTPEEADALISMADAERHDATDYFQFTSLLNDHYGMEQKIKLVEHLWQIANADGVLHRYEEHLVRKIAELLHVPHGAFIEAKHRVLGDRGD